MAQLLQTRDEKIVKVSLEILINEIHPNPESGSEWIEFLSKEEVDENLSLDGYTIFDSYHQIYKFSNEEFIDQILVVEVSGLNNDNDSVILKDSSNIILDSFNYATTQKGLSWSREIEANSFILSTASKNLANLTTTSEITQTTTISPTLTITPTPTATIAASLTPSTTLTIHSPTFTPATLNQKIKKPYKYDLDNTKLKIEEKAFANRETRLVVLGKTQGKAEILNAIIGSSLIILSSFFLIYVKIKGKRS